MEDRKAIAGRGMRIPACSIDEGEGVVTVRLEMPGVAKDALEVRIEGNELAVSGVPGVEAPGGRYLLRERRTESFRKLFTLDETIDREGVDAKLADGILTLKLKLKEAAKPRRIAVG